MKSLHNTNVVRPDVNLEEVQDYSLFELFGQYREYLKDKYIRDDGSIISKGIFESSVYKNCEGFEEKLEKYFGKEYFREVVYCILRDIEYIPRCQICGNLNYLRDWIKGFQKFCSSNCASRSQKTEEWAEKIKASLPKHKYVNERLEKLGIHNYAKDPNDDNYILIYDYCKHHKDEPLRLYFNTLNKLIENGRGTLCIECNQEIYDSYVPTEEETQRFRDEIHLFFREYGAVINNLELSMKFFPKEKKILDLYFENNVFGENKDQIISLNERNYYFEFENTKIPVCKYDGCHNKPRFHRLKAYNLYCDEHLHAFHGQSEFEREVCSYVTEQFDIHLDENNRSVLDGEELDLFYKDKNIGIECNGTFYHTSKRHSEIYHIAKRLRANEKDIKLFSLWSDSWTDKNEICKSYIRRWLGFSNIITSSDISSIKLGSNSYVQSFIENNALYEIEYDEAYKIYSGSRIIGVVAVVLNDDNQFITICPHKTYYFDSKAIKYIVEFMRNNYDSHITVKLDMDVENIENIPEELHYSGISNDNWLWFKSGKRYGQNVFKEGYEKCFRSGVCYYSTDVNFKISSDVNVSEIISDNMSKEEVYECLSDNYIISDDMNMGVDYKTDFHIIASGFDIYIDYKCDDKFGRAFVNLPSDRDLIYASKKINSKYSKNEIEVWSEYEPRKRKYALDNSIIYLELYSCINCEHLSNQIDYILCSLVGENNSILLSDLKDEFEYYSKLCCKKEISEYKVNSKNNIVRYFQWREFYKSELNIYAYNPELRRKLIQNRCQYLDKKESELSFMSLIGGFKKSGIFYGYSHFNPAWSNWFINRYNIKTVYDPFGGWGHHMLGMLSCDRVIYNDIDENVCHNIEKIKKFFNLDFLKVHNSDAAVFYPDDVDAFFMCPPYLNVERYSSRFDTLDDFKNTLNQVFKIWEQNKAYILGIMIREDFISLIDSRYVPLEEHLIDVSDSHFTKEHKKRFKEKLYIFVKSNINT